MGVWVGIGELCGVGVTIRPILSLRSFMGLGVGFFEGAEVVAFVSED